MNAAIKLAPNGAIEAYAVRYGNPDQPDRSMTRDYFTDKTDLMLNEWGWPRPVLLEHMVTPEGERAGSVGQWHSAIKDSVGVKLRGQLNTAHPMYPTLARDIQAGRYFLSSDSAPHLVKRRPMPNGTNELTRWGLLTASLTKSPAEHRLMPATMVKALALKAGARHSGSDAADMQAMHDLTVRQGAACAPAGKSTQQPKRPLYQTDPDLFYSTVAGEAGFEYATRLKREFDLKDSARRLKLEAEFERITETDEAKRARLLRELDRIDPGRRERSSVARPGATAGSVISDFWSSPEARKLP